MNYDSRPQSKRWRLPLAVLSVLVGLVLLNLLLQSVWAHREPYWVPQYPREELEALLEKETRTLEEENTLFLQTGLSPRAVEDLLAQGESGKAQILAAQTGFFENPQPQCVTLIPGRITCEDRQLDEAGNRVYAVPLAPLEAGDIILTFSTHTLGWRHGHASLVVDPVQAITLEAVQLGSDSATVYAQHWRTYSNFMVLRVKDATPEERMQVAGFAIEHLNEIPYSLLAGIFGEKAPNPSDPLIAQCAYLPWYAWQTLGVDLDSDGGRIVTVLDLAESPYLEVVQVYGMEPAALLSRMAR